MQASTAAEDKKESVAHCPISKVSFSTGSKRATSPMSARALPAILSAHSRSHLSEWPAPRLRTCMPCKAPPDPVAPDPRRTRLPQRSTHQQRRVHGESWSPARPLSRPAVAPRLGCRQIAEAPATGPVSVARLWPSCHRLVRHQSSRAGSPLAPSCQVLVLAPVGPVPLKEFPLNQRLDALLDYVGVRQKA